MDIPRAGPRNPVLISAEDVYFRKEMVFTETRLGVGVYKEASLQVPSISGSRCPIGGEEWGENWHGLPYPPGKRAAVEM